MIWSHGINLEKLDAGKTAGIFCFCLGRGRSIMKEISVEEGEEEMDSGHWIQTQKRSFVLNSIRDFHAKMDQYCKKHLEKIYCNYFEWVFPL